MTLVHVAYILFMTGSTCFFLGTALLWYSGP